MEELIAKNSPLQFVEYQGTYMNQPKKLKVASFFSGIGGFDLGFENAGYEVVFQSEINSYCQQILRQHWPKVALAGDILKIESSEIPAADVWCGGFPCQDLSVARGSLGRHGLAGARSGLFYQLSKHAGKHKPRAILFENVHGLLNSNSGRDFQALLANLVAHGYGVSWRLLNSRYFGVPQSRPRIFICAVLGDAEAAGRVLFDNEANPILESARADFLSVDGSSLQGPVVPRVAFCLAATSGRHTGTDWSRTYVAYPSRVRRLTPKECEGLQGFPVDWTVPTDGRFGGGDRIDSLRYHALGNAVSVPVIAWIAARLRRELMARKKKAADKMSPVAKEKMFAAIHPMFGAVVSKPFHLNKKFKEQKKIHWPIAGICSGGTCVAARVAPAPARPVKSSLSALIEKGSVDDRYFLTANAAEGILRRVDSQNRHLFPPLRKSLEKLSGRSTRERVDSSPPTRVDASALLSLT